MPLLQASVMMRAMPRLAESPDFSPYTLDRFDLHHPTFDLPITLSLLASPPLPHVRAPVISNHAVTARMPPLSASLFPSMSDAEDAPDELLLTELAMPPHPTSDDTAHWPADAPTSSSSPITASSPSSSGGESPSAPPVQHAKPSREQRMLSKRLKQRRADLHRRQRETTALSEMKQLIASAKQLTNNCIQSSDDAAEEVAHKDSQHRVQILESSAKRMRELQLLVNLLSQTCEAQQREIHTLSHRLQGRDDHQHPSILPSFSLFEHDGGSMPSGAAPSKRMRLLASTLSSTLNASIGHQSLDVGRCAPIALAAMLVDCSSGIVLDVNDGMLAQGWERDQLVGHTAVESYEAVMDENGWQLGENEEQRLLVPSADGHMRPAGRPAQYDRSKRLMRELYAGAIGVCVARWRVHLSDGLLYEVETSTWIDGWVTAVDAAGRVSRRPQRAVSVSSLGDSQRIE